MKTKTEKSRPVNEITLELLALEIEKKAMAGIFGSITGIFQDMFKGEDRPGRGKDINRLENKAKQLDVLIDHLAKRDPEVARKRDKVKRTQERHKRANSNLASDFNPKGTHYCSKYSNGFEIDPCNEQCFDCIADIGEHQRSK